MRLWLALALALLAEPSTAQEGTAPAAPVAASPAAAPGPSPVVKGAVPAPPVLSAEAGWNDYPTLARADYVFGCLAANGQDRDTMQRCACSIDVIASILPYDAYVSAETVLSMRLGTGERAALFRIPAATAEVADLRRAQAEAEMICF